MPKLNTISDAQFESLRKDWSEIIAPVASARASLDDAKETIESSGDMSIRALSARLARLNGTLDEDQIEKLAEDAGKLYPRSEAKTKSNYKTLLGQARHLPAILVGLDKTFAKIRSKDPKARLPHLVDATLAAARKLRDADEDNPLTVAEAIGKLQLDRDPPTDAEVARTHIARARKLKALTIQVGDERMLDEDADRLLRDLEGIIDGRRPTEDPRIAQLEEELAGLRQLINPDAEGGKFIKAHSLDKVLQDFTLPGIDPDTEEGRAELHSQLDDALSEALEGIADGDEISEHPTTSETEEGTQSLAGSLPEASGTTSEPVKDKSIREKALTPSILGMGGDSLLDELMSLTGKSDSKK